MKHLLHYLYIVLLVLLGSACKKEHEPVAEIPLALEDLDGHTIALQYNDGTLVSYGFYLDNDNILKAYGVDRGGSQSGLTCELKADGTISLNHGDSKFLLSKDNGGKLVIDKSWGSFDQLIPIATIYRVEAAIRFSDKMYKENESSYIGFSNRQWGWSSTTDGIQYTSSYHLNEGYHHWVSTNAVGTTYLGVNIPAGVQWGEHIGPLMLIDRSGFTQPSIYKPL